MKMIIRFLRDEMAATSIEYALIACGIAFVIIAAVNGLGTAMSGRYAAIKDALDAQK
jgi:pilus assembly protein Flp/PilA